jgi:hypothetical protein
VTGRQTSTPTQQERRADLVLRCVELRRMAWWLFDNETDEHLGKHGRIAAQLLEVADREGWWDR